MRKFFFCLLSLGVFNLSLPAREKEGKTPREKKCLIGVSYSSTLGARTGSNYLTYDYSLSSKHLRGISLDYLYASGGVVGLHVQVRLTPYQYSYSTNRDPRWGTYYSYWSKHTEYHVGMLSIDPALTLSTRGERLSVIWELGAEANFNVYGNGNWTSNSWTTTVDTSGNSHTEVQNSSGTADNWDSNLRVQFLFRMGIAGKISNRINYSVLLRPRVSWGYDFIPVENSMTLTSCFSVYYRLNKTE